jgi:hypothetical protein
MSVLIVWACTVCESRMKTLFPKKQPPDAVSTKRVMFPVCCTACGHPRNVEIPETQPVEGASTTAERGK